MTTTDQQNNSGTTTSETPTSSASTSPAQTDLGTEEPTSQASSQEPGSKQTTSEIATDLGSDETDSATDTGEKKDEAKAPEFFGAPENGEYADFVLPDGAEADPALKAEFIPIVKELGLNQAGAQKLVDFKAKLDQHTVQTWGNHVKELKETAMKDPEIGGGNYQPAITASKQAISKFGTPEFRKMLNHYGVGAHPEMIRFLSKVGQATGETTIPLGGGATTVAEKPLHELMYKDP